LSGSVHKNPRSARWVVLGLGAGALLALPGCGDKDIASYRIPKEADAAPATMAAAAPAESTPASAPGSGIRWTAPAGWQQQAASGMRQGSFLVPGPGGATADVSVVSFPGTGGDDLANLNRWRGQLQLPPVAAADLSGQMRALTVPAGNFMLADLAGTVPDKGPTRLLGGWLRQPERVWFFKMMGPAELVGSQKESFLAFVQSVSVAGGPEAPGPLAANGAGADNTNDLPRTSPGDMPPAAPAAGGGMEAIPVQAAGGNSLLWQAPADWQSQPGRPMRKGSYAAAGGAEIAITAFPGDVGGFLANVNRWRGQAGLPPVDDAGLTQATVEIDTNGLHLILVDASAGSPPLLAALLPWNGGTWFFKLTGPPAAVAQAKPAFLAFLKTIRAP
jgi:hypothetical protein